MMDSMDAARIIGYFKGKSILITGSTGFLGKSMCTIITSSTGAHLLSKLDDLHVMNE